MESLLGFVELDFNQCVEEMRSEGTEEKGTPSLVGEIDQEFILLLSSPSWSRWPTAIHHAVKADHKVDSPGRGKSTAYVYT